MSKRKYFSLTFYSWHLVMATPSLVPQITTYHDYFPTLSPTLYKDQYVKALIPYKINVINHIASVTPWYLVIHIFSATNSRDPTSFLL